MKNHRLGHLTHLTHLSHLTDLRRLGRWTATTAVTALLGAGLSTAVTAGTAQAATASRPFPAHVTYQQGVMPSASPSTRDAAVEKAYDSWKSSYLVHGCADNEYYVSTKGDDDAPHNGTVSEAQGYGMNIVPLMAGYDPDAQTEFDGMWQLVKDHEDQYGLMEWQLDGTTCDYTDSGTPDGATDGDLDIGYGLLLADRQWGGYRSDALAWLGRVYHHDVTPDGHLKCEDDGPDTDTRPSDDMLDHLRAFAAFDTAHDWNKVIARMEALTTEFTDSYSPGPKLMSDFVVAADTTSPKPAPADYQESQPDDIVGYNSVRVPWHMGTDALLYGSDTAAVSTSVAKAESACYKSASGGDPLKVQPHIRLNCTFADVSGDTRAEEAGDSAGPAAMVSGDQAWTDAIWNELGSNPFGDAYYGETIKMLVYLVMAGDYWNPTASGTTGPTQLLGDPGFENGADATPWTQSSTLGYAPVNNDTADEPAHSGSWDAWLNGDGSADTDTVAQTVTIPAGSTAALSYWLHIDTTENTGSAKPDTLKAQILDGSGSTLKTLASYSNLDHNTGYTQHTFDLTAYAGQTVTLKFTGTETDADAGTTDFVLDDTALDVSGATATTAFTQADIDDAVAAPPIAFAAPTSSSPRPGTKPSNVRASAALNYLALVDKETPAAESSTGTSVDSALLRQVRSLIAGGHKPDADGGLEGWSHGLVAQALLLLKNGPAWSELSSSEQNKVSLVEEAMGFGGNYTYNDANDFSSGICGFGNFHKTANPNFRDGYVDAELAAIQFFGGASHWNSLLAGFDAKTFAGTLDNAGLTNAGGCFTAVGSAADSAIRPAFVWEGHAASDPTGIWNQLAADTFDKTVTSKVAGTSNGADVTAAIADGTTSPEQGRTGMAHEFVSKDSGGLRSSALYAFEGWMNVTASRAAMSALGSFSCASAPDAGRYLVGTKDLIYKLRHGYISYAKSQDGILVDDHGDPSSGGPAAKGYAYDLDAYDAVLTRQPC
ncbi:glycosyl hydrolase family 8 [Streptomyces beihaiensis]|uniref:Glycosyl hydrolase family 8 n=1 Tax=Streptomyces beihaiensis TaxID=2984495 RepID=A0ABT3TT54_9ACTN|nr:glycosyl hydrolase family 8 [Streptomyces beihaiensis]MCX3060219.1 glycosyl hydrolase family 8 [Streptomyces beihaiensis]